MTRRAVCAGYVGGRMSVVKAPAAAPEAVKPEPPKPKEAPAPAPTFKLVRGQLEYQQGGKNLPDAGARVVVLPEKHTPLRPFSPAGLKPGDENLPDRSWPEGLERIRGAVVTADEQGKFAVEVERPGNYWVLVISAHAPRDPKAPMQADDRSILANYLTNLDTFPGDRQFRVIRRSTLENRGEYNAVLKE